MRTLKLECIWRQRFDIYDAAKAAIAAWVKHYNEFRPHSSLRYLSPTDWRQMTTTTTASTGG